MDVGKDQQPSASLAHCKSLHTHTHTHTHTHQASSGSLDHYSVDDKAERRSSMDNKHHKLERKGSEHTSRDRQPHLERTALERRSSSGDRLSVTPDNISPSPANSPGIATIHGKWASFNRDRGLGVLTWGCSLTCVLFPL